MTQRALFLVNRHARKGQQQLDAATNQLKSLGFELQEASIDHPDQLADVIRDHRGSVDLVIIGGGDGTLNAAAAGLVDTHLPLGILPLGTANDLARTLGIPATLPEACQIIAAGKVQPIDLGWVNGKYFFNVASLGLSVQITRNLTKEVKRRWGVFAYAATAIQALWNSRRFHAEIQMEGRSEKVRAIQIAVGNGRYYGGGMAVAEDAAIDDQRLDLYSLEIEHWWQMLAVLPAMRRGSHGVSPWVQTWQGKEFHVHTRRPRSINTDGEITTSTPAHFRVMPNALSVIVP
ncbi:lipid kinase [Phormidesmis priestleyi ULC007]|uniref:Lipid kinase n=1 Tax=Phormidesmis priestleyi ULC007 TaxID=1920490 RepID=A0A2T1DIN3_9CYAN|nr:lipid kinase [Phormidesmis priestleyi]PSB20294.1 lipid kinase [Phormidesmis priestleyi ULC007]PZO50163.1 MAG: lipid kinase [Phormidesmis priestleyi]